MSLVVRTLADQLYELMRERILTGALVAGAPVRQDAVAEALGVSKIPLREAMSRLEQDGLLASFPNRGFIVRTLSAAEAEEVFRLRLKLEPDAAAEASLQADAAGRQAASDAFSAMEREATSAGPDSVLLNRAFHTALVRPGAGLITQQLIERLHVLAERYVRVHLEPEGRGGRASSEHRAILDAWLARDGGRVRELIGRHISATLEDVRQQLRDAVVPTT